MSFTHAPSVFVLVTHAAGASATRPAAFRNSRLSSIPELYARARALLRTSTVEIQTAAPLIPPRPTLTKLREVAAECTACHLWKLGTQTVFGEGRTKSLIMMVGEQPGDQEDLAGRPFVGPAGALLDQALEEAGIDRAKVYVTNVVKHFKWEPRGKRRIHKKPNGDR